MAKRAVSPSRLDGRWDSTAGLTASEATARAAEYGPNDIVEKSTHPLSAFARDTANHPTIWFFAGTSALYAATGQFLEAVTLLIGIGPLMAMDVFLHRKTQASIEELKGRLAAAATVMRDGVPGRLDAREIVPGDLAVVRSGDMFPADGIIMAGSGGETIDGDIVRSATNAAARDTPLQRAVQRLGSALSVVALVLCIALVCARLAQGYGWVDAAISGVTLVTAALPEEFPVILAFFLGVGVHRLARRQAHVRRAVSVENIGRVTTICSDKTGTITEGVLRLTHLEPAPGITAARLLALAANASRRDHAHSIDTAVFAKLDADGVARAGDTLVTFPFTEFRKRETAIVRDRSGHRVAVAKGAAEIVLAMTDLTVSQRRWWGERVDHLAGIGHKVIACASIALRDDDPSDREPVIGYEMAGLLAFEDPIRDHVAGAVAACRTAGIHTIMVTGDHALTATAVARDIGLGAGSPVVISGDDLEAAIVRGRGDAVCQVDVVARATPAQKLSLVRALQQAGEIVAVTGDGVNDVPALHAADIGLAMGERGTRSAREAASMVLLEDNFATIVNAIAEGRQLFRNLQLSFQYVLLMHIPLVVTATVIPLFGVPLPYLPLHIIWLELIIHPTAVLVFQQLPAPDGLRAERPRRQARLFTARDSLTVVAIGALVTALVTVGYLRSAASGASEHGRAMALAILILSSGAVAGVLSRLRTAAARTVVATTVACSVAVIQFEPAARLIGLMPLRLDDWVIAGLAASLAAGVVAAIAEGVPGRTRLGQPLRPLRPA